jgi:large subunit ribosomal protein L24
MQAKFHIKKGDTVKVLTGDNKGLQGKILLMNVDKQTAVVEGLNKVKKHTRPNSKNTKGGIVEKEAGIHFSNLMLVVAATGEVAKTYRKRNDAGKLVRFSKKTNKEVK